MVTKNHENNSKDSRDQEKVQGVRPAGRQEVQSKTVYRVPYTINFLEPANSGTFNPYICLKVH